MKRVVANGVQVQAIEAGGTQLVFGLTLPTKAFSAFCFALSNEEMHQLGAWLTPENSYCGLSFSSRDGRIYFSIRPCGKKQFCACENALVGMDTCGGKVKIVVVSPTADLHLTARCTLNHLKKEISAEF